MPVADGFIFVAPHPGQGLLLLNCIDPSVTDESDPTSSDPSLDPFFTVNGFQPHPGVTHYSMGFIERYRTAQRARTSKIDDTAKSLIAERMAARNRNKTDPDRRNALLGAVNSIFTVWRTDADPRCFDLSIDPSDRRWETVWGADPCRLECGCSRIRPCVHTRELAVDVVRPHVSSVLCMCRK
jgi:hypothetical protein